MDGLSRTDTDVAWNGTFFVSSSAPHITSWQHTSFEEQQTSKLVEKRSIQLQTATCIPAGLINGAYVTGDSCIGLVSLRGVEDTPADQEDSLLLNYREFGIPVLFIYVVGS